MSKHMMKIIDCQGDTVYVNPRRVFCIAPFNGKTQIVCDTATAITTDENVESVMSKWVWASEDHN